MVMAAGEGGGRQLINTLAEIKVREWCTLTQRRARFKG